MQFFAVSFFRKVMNFGRESVFLIVLSILLADVVAFLIWKDRSGRTVVNSSQCPYLSDLKGDKRACRCSKRLAFRTVDSLIAKLRAILAEIVSEQVGIWSWMSVILPPVRLSRGTPLTFLRSN